MGNCIRSILKRLQRKRSIEKTIVLLVVGLDNAGKTLVLNHISGDPDRNVLPTMGFHTVSLRHKSYLVKIYDIGGSSQIRSLWPKYYNDIHGVIYVVDASDISRLTENKVVFGELVSHEHISGKPILVLANKQDLNGAIDELDLVENLDVESAANAMRCPTRVEICSCIYESMQSQGSTKGIKNGYKWLLDTILKNYTALNTRVKDSQSLQHEIIRENESIVPDTPSKLSIHSNPFKPIKELLSKQDENALPSNSQNGTYGGNKLRKIFSSRNKTAPLSPVQPITEFNNCTESSRMSPNISGENLSAQKSTQTISSILDPRTLDEWSNDSRLKQSRPYTAPERSQHFGNKMTVINIPGQVTE